MGDSTAHETTLPFRLGADVTRHPLGVNNGGTPARLVNRLTATFWVRPFMRSDWHEALAEASRRGYDATQGTRISAGWWGRKR